MEEMNKDLLVEKMIYSICDFKDEVIKSMNYIRQDMNFMRDELKGEIKDLRLELKGEIYDLRQELRDYKEENNRRWDENEKRWEKYEANRKDDRKFLLDTLIDYDLSISEQLGDPNVEKMRKVV